MDKERTLSWRFGNLEIDQNSMLLLPHNVALLLFVFNPLTKERWTCINVWIQWNLKRKYILYIPSNIELMGPLSKGNVMSPYWRSDTANHWTQGNKGRKCISLKWYFHHPKRKTRAEACNCHYCKVQILWKFGRDFRHTWAWHLGILNRLYCGNPS